MAVSSKLQPNEGRSHREGSNTQRSFTWQFAARRSCAGASTPVSEQERLNADPRARALSLSGRWRPEWHGPPESFADRSAR
jgi:hypothetical protein